MARQRPKDTRTIGKKIVIFCEGSKSEPMYFKGLKRALGVHRSRVEVEVVDTEYTSCVQLVREAASRKRSSGYTRGDEFWVVVDKDGYTHHEQCFDNAKGKGIKIAFSAVAFEFWVLLHFEYTTGSFRNSDALIRRLRTAHGIAYEKNMDGLYALLQGRETKAKARAQRIRDHHKASSPGQRPYGLDPYTDVDKLVQSIQNSAVKPKGGRGVC